MDCGWLYKEFYPPSHTCDDSVSSYSWSHGDDGGCANWSDSFAVLQQVYKGKK